MFISVLFFFFKQKTAYELRISDWSSDVCSSDLAPGGWPVAGSGRARYRGMWHPAFRRDAGSLYGPNLPESWLAPLPGVGRPGRESARADGRADRAGGAPGA